MRRRLHAYVFFLLLAVIASIEASAQLKLVAFESLDSLQKMEKRPVVVFVHTNWCVYCGAMKNSTFKKKDVVQVLNDKFYFVSLDAEDRRTVHFNGHEFIFKPKGINSGVHELAEQLGTVDGMLGYPVVCFLNPRFEITYQHPGYLSPKEFLKLLKQIANNS
jgi:thioredoxin-related protein